MLNVKCYKKQWIHGRRFKCDPTEDGALVLSLKNQQITTFFASAIKYNNYCPALSELVHNELQTLSSQVLNGHTDEDGVFAQACCCEF